MFTIHSLMLVSLGFLLATLLGFLVAPAYWKRAVRLTTERLRRSLPMTLTEIRAQQDRLRAQHAIRVHQLETQSDRARLSDARQRIEINRRDAAISTLERQLKEFTTNLEASENARRVLEQTITDRIPTIEQRLTETRELLKARDDDVARLQADSERTFQALDEAMQINVQQREEVDRLRSLLATQKGEDGTGKTMPRFDTEIALRSELEELRARARDQASLISRLQAMLKDRRAELEKYQSQAQSSAAILKMPERDGTDAHSDRPDQIAAASLNAEISVLKAANRSLTIEIETVKSELTAARHDAGPDGKPGSSAAHLQDSKAALRAQLKRSESDARALTNSIARLKAELAAANERLANQAKAHREELRKLGLGTVLTSVSSQAPQEQTTPPAQQPPAVTPSRPPSKDRQAEPSLTSRIIKQLPETADTLNGHVSPRPPKLPANPPPVASTARASDAPVPDQRSDDADDGASETVEAIVADEQNGAVPTRAPIARAPKIRKHPSLREEQPAEPSQRVSAGRGLMDRIAGLGKS